MAIQDISPEVLNLLQKLTQGGIANIPPTMPAQSTGAPPIMPQEGRSGAPSGQPLMLDQTGNPQVMRRPFQLPGPPEPNIPGPPPNVIPGPAPNRNVYDPSSMPSGGLGAAAASISPVQQKFQDTLNQVPQHADFKPSIGRRIGGALVGLASGDKKLASQFEQRPYNQAAEDWTNKIASIKPMVDLEQQRQQMQYQQAKLAEDVQHKANQDTVAGQKVDIFKERTKRYGEDIESKIARRESLSDTDLLKVGIPKSETARVMMLEPSEQVQYVDLYNKMHAKETPEQGAAKTTAKEEAKIATDLKHKDDLGQIAAATAGERTGASKKAEVAVNITPEAKQAAKNISEGRSEGTISANEKDVVHTARKGLNMMPRIYSMIDDLGKKGKLSTLMPRWQEFMAGTVGNNPEFAPLRLDIGLMQTLLSRVHGGARGGGSPAMMKHFQDLMSASKMNEQTLRSTLKEVEMWLGNYANDYKDSVPNDPNLEKPEVPVYKKPTIKVNGKELQ